jgi:hypothetical protein
MMRSATPLGVRGSANDASNARQRTYLLHRMVPIARRRLRHLCNQRLESLLLHRLSFQSRHVLRLAKTW